MEDIMNKITKLIKTVYCAEFAIYNSSLERYKQLMDMSAFQKIEGGVACRSIKLKR